MDIIDQPASGSFSTHRRDIVFNRAGIFLLLALIAAGIIYGITLPAVARFNDEIEYLKLSDNLVHGPGYSMDGVHLTASRPPGYAFFLASMRLWGGEYITFRIVQVLLLGATVLLICRLWSDQKFFAGLLVVTALVICYPVLLYTSTTLYPQTLSAFLFILSLTLIQARSGTLLQCVAAGLAFGALIVVVPTFGLTLPVVIAGAWLWKIIPWQNGLVVVFAAALLVGSWTVRNAVVFHRFVPIASNTGFNLLLGNNERATPFEAAANDGAGPYSQEAAKLHLDEFDLDRFYKDAAVHWVTEHPGHALLLYLEKVLNFFNVMNVYVPGLKGEVSISKQIVMAASYLLLMGFLAWRLADCKRFPLLPREKWFLLIYVLTAFTSAIFFTRIRHRLPFDYLIIAVVAFHISRRLESRLTGKAPGVPAPDESIKSRGGVL